MSVVPIMREDDVVKRLDVKIGDIVVLTVKDRLTGEQHAKMRAGIERIVPFGVKVIILDNETGLIVIRKEEIHGNGKEAKTPRED